jgi:Txe/YoeB family toxin of Txe-Axe toxin-antitoxin module
VARLREEIEIDAAPERVWAVVAEDVKNAPKWTSNLDKVEKLEDGPPGRGTRYRYHLSIGGQKHLIEVVQDVWEKPRRCAGRFIKGPLKGTWSYTYARRRDGTTRLVYEMDYELAGLLRFATGVFAPQYAAGIHKNMESLKRYVESGKGPKPDTKTAKR